MATACQHQEVRRQPVHPRRAGLRRRRGAASGGAGLHGSREHGRRGGDDTVRAFFVFLSSSMSWPVRATRIPSLAINPGRPLRVAARVPATLSVHVARVTMAIARALPFCFSSPLLALLVVGGRTVRVHLACIGQPQNRKRGFTIAPLLRLSPSDRCVPHLGRVTASLPLPRVPLMLLCTINQEGGTSRSWGDLRRVLG